MPKFLVALACGALFGIGLAISQMAIPAKVLGFLDVTGNWDPSLLFVLGGAVTVTALAFRFVLRLPKPVFDVSFESPTRGPIDTRLLGGAVLFGIGWGLGGYCPGPGIVSLGRLAPDAFVFVAAFLVGSLAFRLANRAGAFSSRRTEIASSAALP